MMKKFEKQVVGLRIKGSVLTMGLMLGALVSATVSTLVGCGQIPDPNDLSRISQDERADAAYRIWQAAIGTLEFKVTKNEILDRDRNELIRKTADDLLKAIDIKQTPPADAWMLADMLRATNRWEDAEKEFEIAVKNAASVDRKVNDTLRLAQAQAKNGKAIEAIATAKKVYDVPDDQSAPILPATLYEIVPAAEGKGHDKELAELLELAIRCHERTVVDIKTDDGRIFMAARRYHINKATTKAAVLRGVAHL
jgi:hypothetical protein